MPFFCLISRVKCCWYLNPRSNQIDDAIKRLEKSDVKYRFAIDMASLKG